MGGSTIPLRRKLGYSVGHVLNDLTASIWFSYLITYFHEVKQFDDYLAGYLMLIGQVADAILTPIIGIACDKSNHGCCGIGKRKSWHVIGTTSIALSFPFIFIPCYKCEDVEDWVQFIYYVPIIILFQFGWASLQISHLSLIPEMTYSSTEKVQLNGWRYATTVLSHTAVYLLALLLMDLHKDKQKLLNAEDAHTFRNLAVCVTVIGIVFSCIFYFCVHERENPTYQQSGEQKTYQQSGEQKIYTNCTFNTVLNNSTDTQRKSDIQPEATVEKTYITDQNSNGSHIWTLQEHGCMSSSMISCSNTDIPLDILNSLTHEHNDTICREKQNHMKSSVKLSRHWKQWLKHYHFYQMALIYMCTRLVVNISEIYMPMYITESLQMEKKSVAVVPMIGYIAGFFTSLFMRSTNKLLGRKRTYIIGQSFTLGACIWLFFIDKETSSRIYGVATLFGIGGSTVLVTSLSMTADLIDEYSGSAGFVYGAMSFLEKLANGIAVVMIQRLNPCRNTDPTSEDLCTSYYRNIIVTVPGGVTFISLLVILSLMPTIGGVHDWKNKDHRHAPSKRGPHSITSHI